MTMTLEEFEARNPGAVKVEAPRVGMRLEDFDKANPTALAVSGDLFDEFKNYITYDQLPDQPDEFSSFFSNIPSSSIRQGLNIMEQRQAARGENLRTDLYKDKVIKQLVAKGFNLHRNDEGEWTHYYNQPISDLTFRAKFGLLDTDEERRSLLEDRFGEGKVNRDGAGRWMYWKEDLNKGKGAWASVDSENLELADTADIMKESAQVAAEVGAMFLVPELQGPRWIVRAAQAAKIGTEVAAPLAVHEALERLENSLGINMESSDAQMSRFYQEAVEYTGWALGTRLAALGVNRFWSPLPGGISSETRRLTNDVMELNALRDARSPEEWLEVRQRMEQFNDLPEAQRNALINDPNRLWEDFKLRTSQVNSAPILARVEGILSKFPGSSGVYRKNAEALQQAIDEEVAWLLRDVPNATEYAPILKGKLQQAINERQLQQKSFYDKYVSGLDPNTGGRIVKDSVERAKLQFRDEADVRYSYLDWLIRDATGMTNSAIVPTKFLKEEIETIRREAGNVGLRPGTSKYFEELEALPEFLNMQEFKRLKNQFGDIKSGTTVIPDMDTRDMSRLYSSINKGVTDLDSLTKNMGPEFAAKFKRELEETQAWYEGNHILFSDPEGSFAKVITKYKDSSTGMYKLVRSMMGGGNEAYVRRMFSVMDADEIAQFKSIAQDYVMDGKTPAQMQKYLNNSENMGTYEAIFGRDQFQAMRDFADEAVKFQYSPAAKLARESSEAMKLLNNTVKKNDYSGFKAIVDELGEGSQEVEMMRNAFMAKLIQEATQQTDNSLYSTISGTALLNQIDKTYGAGVVKNVLGEEKYKNLRLLAEISKATRSGDAAGGLAAGFFILNTMRTANLISAGVFSAKAYLAARLVSSAGAQKWLSHEPLSDMTKTQWRAAIASIQLLGEPVQGKEKLRNKAFDARYQSYRTSMNPRAKKAKEMAQRVLGR